MYRMHKTIGVFAFLALAISLVGCSTATVVAPPTPDIPSIRTESAQTVVAKLTIEAALNTTPTAEPTQTPLPSATFTLTPTATQAVVLPPTATLVPTLAPATGGTSGGTSGGSVVYPTATRRAGPDQAQYVSQSPADGTAYPAGYIFDSTWTFKNIGTSTWNSHYYYRFANQGTNLAKADRYYLKDNVKPGDSVTLVADMQAPPQAGRYVSYWQLVNDNGATFFEFFLIIDVK